MAGMRPLFLGYRYFSTIRPHLCSGKWTLRYRATNFATAMRRPSGVVGSRRTRSRNDRHKTGILGSGHGKGFALPSLPSDRRSVSRALWATGALSKTPVFRNHLDILIYFFDSGDRVRADPAETVRSA